MWDEQGKSSKASTTLTVQENPDKLNIVEAVLNEKIGTLTKARIDSLKQSIGLLLRSSAKKETEDINVEPPLQVKIIEIFPQRHTGKFELRQYHFDYLLTKRQFFSVMMCYNSFHNYRLRHSLLHRRRNSRKR